VKILYTREEVFYSHRGRHPMLMKMSMGADAEGALTGVDNDICIDGGAYHSFGLVTTYYAGQLLTGPVKLATYRFQSKRVYTNKPCCGPKRGHGSVQPRFASRPRSMSSPRSSASTPSRSAASNAMSAGERTVNGQLVPSCGLRECLDAVESASGWKQRHGKLGPSAAASAWPARCTSRARPTRSTRTRCRSRACS
jgi:4-hydroxybenzoyl-CoA reductase subunit alpha